MMRKKHPPLEQAKTDYEGWQTAGGDDKIKLLNRLLDNLNGIIGTKHPLRKELVQIQNYIIMRRFNHLEHLEEKLDELMRKL